MPSSTGGASAGWPDLSRRAAPVTHARSIAAEKLPNKPLPLVEFRGLPLGDAMQAFAEQKINLTHIEKRPSGRKNWTYTFLVDALGHRDEAAMTAALTEAKHHCKDLVVLGSYPRSKRVL
jgi:prephenate dehydratase